MLRLFGQFGISSWFPVSDARRLAGRQRTKNAKPSVFGKDGRSREAVFMAEGSVAQIFLPRHSDDGPVRRTDTDDSCGTDALDDEVRFKTDLDAAAAQRRRAVRLRDVEDGAF